MASFLPSEIARLVLGYLEEVKCEEAFNYFLKTCSHLKECVQMKEEGRKFRTDVWGLSLLNILYEYSAIYSLVQERLKKGDTEALEKLRHSGTLLDKITFLLNASSTGQTMFFSISVPPGNSPQMSTVAHAHLRKRLRTSSSNEKRKLRRSENENTLSNVEMGNKEISMETTDLNSLPGNSASAELQMCNVDETDVNKTPKRKIHSISKRQPIVVSEEVEENLDFAALQKALLDNHELHEKIAENINKRILTPDINMSAINLPNLNSNKTLNNTQLESSIIENNNFTMELDNAIEKIVQETESDPIIDKILDEVIGPVTREETSDDYDEKCISETSTPCKVSTTSKKKRAASETSVETKNQCELDALNKINEQNSIAIDGIVSVNVANRENDVPSVTVVETTDVQQCAIVVEQSNADLIEATAVETTTTAETVKTSEIELSTATAASASQAISIATTAAEATAATTMLTMMSIDESGTIITSNNNQNNNNNANSNNTISDVQLASVVSTNQNAIMLNQPNVGQQSAFTVITEPFPTTTIYQHHPQQQQQQPQHHHQFHHTIQQQQQQIPENRIIFLNNRAPTTLTSQYITVPAADTTTTTYQLAQPTATVLTESDILTMPTVIMCDEQQTMSSGYIVPSAATTCVSVVPYSKAAVKKKSGNVKLVRKQPVLRTKPVLSNVDGNDLQTFLRTEENDGVKYIINIQAESLDVNKTQNKQQQQQQEVIEKEETSKQSGKTLTDSSKKPSTSKASKSAEKKVSSGRAPSMMSLSSTKKTPTRSCESIGTRGRLSLSSPRSNRSHIRALDFSTPVPTPSKGGTSKPVAEQVRVNLFGSPAKPKTVPKSPKIKLAKSPISRRPQRAAALKSKFGERSNNTSDKNKETTKATEIAVVAKEKTAKTSEAVASTSTAGATTTSVATKIVATSITAAVTTTTTTTTSATISGSSTVTATSVPNKKSLNSWDQDLRSLIEPVKSPSVKQSQKLRKRKPAATVQQKKQQQQQQQQEEENTEIDDSKTEVKSSTTDLERETVSVKTEVANMEKQLSNEDNNANANAIDADADNGKGEEMKIKTRKSKRGSKSKSNEKNNGKESVKIDESKPSTSASGVVITDQQEQQQQQQLQQQQEPEETVTIAPETEATIDGVPSIVITSSSEMETIVAAPEGGTLRNMKPHVKRKCNVNSTNLNTSTSNNNNINNSIDSCNDNSFNNKSSTSASGVDVAAAEDILVHSEQSCSTKKILSPSKMNANKRTLVEPSSTSKDTSLSVAPTSDFIQLYNTAAATTTSTSVSTVGSTTKQTTETTLSPPSTVTISKVPRTATVTSTIAKRNLVPMLETPLKNDSLFIPITPRLHTPFNCTIESPLTLAKINTGDLVPLIVPSITTPNFPNTPSFPMSSLIKDDSLISYTSRPTDYSTSSSYYQPSDSEQNQRLEQMLIEEAQKCEMQTSTPRLSIESCSASAEINYNINAITNTSGNSAVDNNVLPTPIKQKIHVDMLNKDFNISSQSSSSDTSTSSSASSGSSSNYSCSSCDEDNNDGRKKRNKTADQNNTVIHVPKTPPARCSKTPMKKSTGTSQSKSRKTPLKKVTREIKSKVTKSHVMLLKELDEKRKRMMADLKNEPKKKTTPPGRKPKAKIVKKRDASKKPPRYNVIMTRTRGGAQKKTPVKATVLSVPPVPPTKSNEIPVTNQTSEPKSSATKRKTTTPKKRSIEIVPDKTSLPSPPLPTPPPPQTTTTTTTKTTVEVATINCEITKESTNTSNAKTIEESITKEPIASTSGITTAAVAVAVAKATTAMIIDNKLKDKLLSPAHSLNASSTFSLNASISDDQGRSYTPDDEFPRLHISSDEECNLSLNLNDPDVMVKELKERGIHLIHNKQVSNKKDGAETKPENIEKKESKTIEIISDIHLKQSEQIDVSRIKKTEQINIVPITTAIPAVLTSSSSSSTTQVNESRDDVQINTVRTTTTQQQQQRII